MYHSEGAPGQVRPPDPINAFLRVDLSHSSFQYEVVTGPMSPLEAADALVHTRETIYNIASKHGVKATFAPKLPLDTCQ